MADQAGFSKQPAEWRAQPVLRARAELNLATARTAPYRSSSALDLDGTMGTTLEILIDRSACGDAALIYIDGRLRTQKASGISGLHRRGSLSRRQRLGGRGRHVPPVCGPDIAPEDTAVVEFADDLMAVLPASPIYSSRPGPSASPSPAPSATGGGGRKMAKLDPFWRVSIRVQLRCAVRPPPLSLEAPFYEATLAWPRSTMSTKTSSILARAGTRLGLPRSTAGAAAIPAQFRADGGSTWTPVAPPPRNGSTLLRRNWG